MTVTRIRSGDLEIKVTDPAVQQRLTPWDLNHDGTLEEKDFPKPSYDPARPKQPDLASVVADAYVPVIDGASAYQNLGIREIFSTWENVKHFDETTSSWSDHNINTTVGELEFDPAYWNNHISSIHFYADEYKKGIAYYVDYFIDLSLRRSGVSGVTSQVVSMIAYLVGRRDNSGCPYVDGSPSPFGGHNLAYKPDLFLFQYDNGAIPHDLQEVVATIADRYSRSAQYLLQYEEIECEGSGCPSIDELSIRKSKLVPFVSPAPFTACY